MEIGFEGESEFAVADAARAWARSSRVDNITGFCGDTVVGLVVAVVVAWGERGGVCDNATPGGGGVIDGCALVPRLCRAVLAACLDCLVLFGAVATTFSVAASKSKSASTFSGICGMVFFVSCRC